MPIKNKNVERKKKEILDQINELKINYDALSLINRRLVKEKRQGPKVDFRKKDLMEKKRDLLKIISREDEAVFWKTVTPIPVKKKKK